MVFLTAAAVTAGAYGAYKGGEAAVKGAKSKVRDIKLERSGKKEYDAKSKERRGRLASIEQKHGAASGSGGAAGSVGSFMSGATGASAARSGTTSGGSAKESVEERLKERRSAKACASTTKGGSVLGRFSKKK